MIKNDIDTFFKLDAKLFMALTEWLHKTVKGSSYEKTPYKVLSYSSIDNDCIGLKILFLTNEIDIGVEEYYRVPKQELEQY